MRPALRGFLAALALVAGPACAQVEWFATERPGESGYRFSSYIGTMAGAPGGAVTQPCSFTGANVPVPTPEWWKQFKNCRPDALKRADTLLSFRSDDTHTARNAGAQVVTTATQKADFGPNSLALTATIDVRHGGDKTAGIRVLPGAFGEIYFRVPDGPDQRVTLRGSLTWSGAATAWNGSFGISWVPNTLKGANRLHYGIHPNMVTDKGATQLVFDKDQRLSPGVYSVTWSVRDDRTGADSHAELAVDLLFGDGEEVCADPPWSRAPARWSPGTSYSATFKAEELPGMVSKFNTEATDWGNQAKLRWQYYRQPFTLSKGGKTTRHEGWVFVPGTIRRERGFSARCHQIDTHFNCHGLTLAAGTLWLQDAVVDEILNNWCHRVDGAQRRALPKDTLLVRMFKTESSRSVVPLVWSERVVELAHSQFVRAGDAAVIDEKLGPVIYGIKGVEWTSGGIESYWRCDF